MDCVTFTNSSQQKKQDMLWCGQDVLTVHKLFALFLEFGRLLAHLRVQDPQLVEVIKMKASLCQGVVGHDCSTVN